MNTAYHNPPLSPAMQTDAIQQERTEETENANFPSALSVSSCSYRIGRNRGGSWSPPISPILRDGTGAEKHVHRELGVRYFDHVLPLKQEIEAPPRCEPARSTVSLFSLFSLLS